MLDSVSGQRAERHVTSQVTNIAIVQESHVSASPRKALAITRKAMTDLEDEHRECPSVLVEHDPENGPQAKAIDGDASEPGGEGTVAANGSSGEVASARSEVWPGVFCFIRIDQHSLKIEFDAESAYSLRFSRSEVAQESGDPLELLVAAALREIASIAYQRGRSDAKAAVLDAL